MEPSLASSASQEFNGATNCEPIAENLYHSTTTPLDRFDPWSHFGPLNAARAALFRNFSSTRDNFAGVYRCRLDICSPFEIEDNWNGEECLFFNDHQLARYGVLSTAEVAHCFHATSIYVPQFYPELFKEAVATGMMKNNEIPLPEVIAELAEGNFARRQILAAQEEQDPHQHSIGLRDILFRKRVTESFERHGIDSFKYINSWEGWGRPDFNYINLREKQVAITATTMNLAPALKHHYSQCGNDGVAIVTGFSIHPF